MVVSSGASKHRINKVFLLIFGSIFIIAIGIAGWVFYEKSIPALAIGNIKVSKKDYQELIKQAAKDNISKPAATDKLIEIEKTIYAGKILNIKVSDDAIRDAGAVSAGVYNPKDLNQWQLLNGQALAIKNSILFSAKGGYDAALFTFPFSRHFMQTLPNGIITDTNFGNRIAIKDDQNYALAQANAMHDKLVKKTITTSAAVTQLRKDSRLDYGGAGNDSNEFFVDLDGKIHQQGESVTEILDSVYFEALKKLNPGSLSDVATQQLFVNFSPLKDYVNKMVDADYFFVELKAKYNPDSGLQSKFDNQIKGVKVKRHV